MEIEKESLKGGGDFFISQMVNAQLIDFIFDDRNNKESAFSAVSMPGDGWFDDEKASFFFNYENEQDVLNKVIEKIEHWLGDFDVKDIKDIEQVRKEIKDALEKPPDKPLHSAGYDGIRWTQETYDSSIFVKVPSNYHDYFFLKLINLKFLNITSMPEKYNKIINWVRSQNENELKVIVDFHKNNPNNSISSILLEKMKKH